MSFRIIKHPFFIDFIKKLNAIYNLLSQNYLSRHLLKSELITVNENI